MKKTALLISLSVLSTSVLLVGCGGGGSSSVKSVVVAPTTITTNSFVSLNAISNEVNYVAIGAAAISTVDLGISQTSTANLTYDAGGNLTKLVITTPNSAPGSSISWSSISGDTSTAVPSTTDHIVLSNTGNNYSVLMIDPNTSAFDYQAFGAWRTGNGTSTGKLGVLSAGLRTDVASVPTTAAPATFTGKLLGVHVDAVGLGNFVTGDVSITSDFAARTLAFSTSGTSTINPASGVTSAASNLDLAGTLSYGAGANLFSGSVSAVGAGLTGTASGAFYGPAAEEVGGAFNVKAASGVEFYSGSFGAKQ